ncbi:hypothetical protein J7I98_09375 [Streptomyces sp. ISL-98]|uniref:hypothetical protein n=1 Tax=Streptomyces sp. ISL-98 TaxID=2819192 RepID=UPI001BE72708|nr:hypothetical protein [Streptomyces sp. ISL-98]MBT2506103.1 hypothetical protein [Streptomyces sp. ISL-98]
MSIRHTMKARRALTAVAITTGLVFTVAGCGGDEESPSDNSKSSSTPPAKQGDDGEKESKAPEPDQVLAEVKGGKDVTLVISSAVRDQGGFLTVSGKVTNGGSAIWSADQWQGSENELAGNGASMAGANLVSKTEKKRYLVLRDTDGKCLCTRFTGLSQNQSAEWYAQFPAPSASTTEVDFQIADMPAATIKITDGE